MPIPDHPLQLEPLAPDTPVASPVLETYLRNAGDRAPDEVEVLRDMPFGHAPAATDVPFFLDGEPSPSVLDDADTEGIPVGLPDLTAPIELPAVATPESAPARRELSAPVGWIAGVSFVLGMGVGVLCAGGIFAVFG